MHVFAYQENGISGFENYNPMLSLISMSLKKEKVKCQFHLSTLWTRLDRRGNEGEWRGGSVKLAKNRLILSQIYTTLLYSLSLNPNRPFISTIYPSNIIFVTNQTFFPYINIKRKLICAQILIIFQN